MLPLLYDHSLNIIEVENVMDNAFFLFRQPHKKYKFEIKNK